MEEYGNNEIFGVDRKQMRAVDGKQKIYLEWPQQELCWNNGTFTKEILGTKIAEYNYSQTLTSDEYKSNNITSQKELQEAFLVILVLITLGLSIYQLLKKLWTLLSPTQ